MRYQQIAAGVLFSLLAACGDKAGAPARAAQYSARPDTASASASSRTELKAMPMLPAFRAHLDTLSRAPKMAPAAKAQHMSEVKHLVDAMHSDMIALGMAGDAAYEALADSVVKGSEQLGNAAGADFKRRLARHMDQLHRLTAAYESKTASMKQAT
jgi:hypothetical protein